MGIFKKQSIRVGTLILGVFLLIYLPALLYIMYSNGIETDLLKYGKIEQVQNVEGIFVRNETVINSPDTGSCVMDVSEGEKVPAFCRIASIVKNVPVSTYEELKKKDMEIKRAQEAQKDNVTAFSGDIHKLDQEIIENVKKLANQSGRGSLIDSNDTIKGIDNVIYKKANIFGDGSKSAAYIKKLQSEKAGIESKLNNNIKEISAPTSGLVSYAIDGYESLLTLDYIKNATPKDLDKITTRQTNRDFNVIDAQQGKPVAKLVKDLESYIAVMVDAKATENLTLDDSIKIRVNDTGLTFDAVIIYSSNVMDGKRIICLKFDTYLNETIGLRRINADLILSGASGLKVPRSCLQNIDYKNKTADIIMVKGMAAKTIKISIKCMNQDAAIIENLKGKSSIALYNTYVLNPKNVREGQMIN